MESRTSHRRLPLTILFLSLVLFVFSLPMVASAHIVFSGTLFESDGSTTFGSGYTVTAAVGTSTVSFHSVTTDGSGDFTIDINNPTGLSSTTPVTLFVDGATATTSASTLTYGVDDTGSTSTITSIDLFANTVIMNNATGTEEIDLSEANQPDSEDDADILFIATTSTTTIGSSATTTHFIIATGTTLFASSVLELYGDLTLEGEFRASGGEVRFLGLTPAVTGDFTGANAFADMSVEAVGAGRSWNAFFAEELEGSQFRGIASDQTRIVVAGSLSTASFDVAYSDDDGYTWSTTTTGDAGPYWEDVAYGDGRFVVVGSGCVEGGDSCIYTSTDGASWSIPDTFATSSSWYRVVYGGGRFVAINNFSSPMVTAYSDDGLTWATTTIEGISSFEGLTYDGSQFVGVTDDGPYILTSTDGSSWATSSMTAFNDVYSIGYGDGLYTLSVREFDFSYTIATSSDLTNWSTTTIPYSPSYLGLTDGGYGYAGNHVFIDAFYNAGIYSTDGSVWNEIDTIDCCLDYSFGNLVNHKNRLVGIDSGPNGGAIAISYGDVSFGAPFTVDNVTFAAGSALIASGTVTVSGDLAKAGGYFFTDSSSVIFDGASAQTITGDFTGAEAFSSVTFSGAGSKTFVSSSTEVTNFTIGGTSGTVVAPEALSLSGDFTNNGTFDANSGLVELTGASQTLLSLGTTTFYDLRQVLSQAPATTTFGAGDGFVVSNNLFVDGTASVVLTWQSDSALSNWSLDVTGNYSVSRIELIDTQYVGSQVFFCSQCVDGGGNSSVLFDPEFGGVVYTNEGVTGAGPNIQVFAAVGTSTPGVFTATTSFAGGWAMLGIDISTIPSTTPVLVWVDGATTTANTLVQGLADATAVSNIPLYNGQVVSYGATSTSRVWVEDFDFYDSDVSSSSFVTIAGATSTFSLPLINVRGEFVAPNSGTLLLSKDFNQTDAFDANGSTVRVEGVGVVNLQGSFVGTNALNDIIVDADYGFGFDGNASSSNVTILETRNQKSTLTYTGNSEALPSNPYSAAWNGTGEYLAAAHSSGNNLSFYRLDGDTLTKLADPTSPGTTAYSVAWNGDYLAVGLSGGGLKMYKRSGDTLTALADPTAPGGSTIYGLDWTGNYLAVAYSGGNLLSFYRLDGDTLTKLADPTAPGTSIAYDVSWSGDLLAVADNVNGATLYERVGDTLIQHGSTSDLVGNDAYSVAWNEAGDRLLVGDDVDWVNLYERSSTTLTKLDEYDLVGGTLYDIEVDGDTFMVADYFGPNNIAVLRIDANDELVKLSDIADVNLGTFYTRGMGYNGEYLAVVDLIVDGVYLFSFGSGAFSLGSTSALTVNGDFRNEGANLTNEGTLYLTGASGVVENTATSTVSQYTLGNLVIDGDYGLYGVASTTDIIVRSGASLSASSGPITIAGNLSNQGDFDFGTQILYLTGNDTTISGDFTGANAFNDLVLTGGKKTFLANASMTDLLIEPTAGYDVEQVASVSGVGGRAVEWNDEGTYGTYGGSSIQLVKRTGDTFEVVDSDVDPGYINDLDWNGDYIAAADDSLNTILMYRRDGDTLVRLADADVAPESQIWGATWYQNHLAVGTLGGNNLFHYIFDPNTETLTKQPDPQSPTGRVYGLDFSEDGYLAVPEWNGGNDNEWLHLYKIENDALVKLPRVLQPNETSKFNAAWSGRYLAVVGGFGVWIYKRVGDELIPLPTPADPGNLPYAADWSGRYLAVSSGNGGSTLAIYRRDGDIVSKIQTPANITEEKLAWVGDEYLTLPGGEVFRIPRGGLVSSSTLTIAGDLRTKGPIDNTGTLMLTGNENVLELDIDTAPDEGIGDVEILGNYTASGTATMRNLTVRSGATATASIPFVIEGTLTNEGVLVQESATTTVFGDFINNGSFIATTSTVRFASSTGAQTATGTLAGANAFSRIEVSNDEVVEQSNQSLTFGVSVDSTDTFFVTGSSTVSFLAGATSTFENVDWRGLSDSTQVKLRSTASGTDWYLDIPGSQLAIDYIDVQDSNASTVAGGVNALESTDGGNNTNWNFGTAEMRPTLATIKNQRFVSGQGTQMIEPIVYTEVASSSYIYARASADLRFTIATTAVDMRWNTSDNSMSFSGTGASKVDNIVTFEDGGATMVVNVRYDFDPLDTLTISGLKFDTFGATNTATSALYVSGDGPGDVTFGAYDTATVEIVASSTAWNATDWTSFARLTINAANIDDDLTDFPVYVNLADMPAEFWSTVRDDGGDIRVTTDDGAPVELAREVAYIATSTETGELYFKAPTISSTTNTSFRIYYNGTNEGYLPGNQNGTWDVWTNNYNAVFHLTEDANLNRDNFKDSTSNNNHATAYNIATDIATTSKLGRGLDLDGGNDHLEWRRQNGIPGGTSDRTISVWAETDTISGGTDYAFGYGNNRNEEGFAIRQNNGSLQGWWNSGNVSTSSFWSTDTYEHSVFTYDGTDAVLYGRGEQVDSATVALATDNGRGTLIGARPDDDNDNWNGIIDEARIASVVRDAAWVSAEYLNQATSTDFYTLNAGTSTLTLSSNANQSFVIGDATTTISTITVSDASPTPTITAANDIRIAIATGTVAMEWDTTDTTATVSGIAAAKVSSTVSYEGGGSVLVLDVTSDFSAGEAIAIDDLSFVNFTASNTATSALSLHTGGSVDMSPNAVDDKTVVITEVSLDGEWNDTAWLNYDAITIDAANIDDDLVNFPVYVDLSDLSAQFWSTVSDNGGDIRITTGTSSPYEVPHELVSIATSTSDGELHFKAPSISSTTDTEFRIYYNGVSQAGYATDATYGAENVWTNDYVLVTHDGVTDSTVNNHNGQTNGNAATTSSLSKVGATAVIGDGTGDYIDFGDIGMDGISEISVAMFLRSDTSASNGAIFGTRTTTDITDSFTGIRYDSAGAVGGGTNVFKYSKRNNSGSDIELESANQSAAYTEWQHLAYVSNTSSAPLLYVDGAQTTPTGSVGGAPGVIDFPVFALMVGARDELLDGTVDEVRVSSSSRSSAWISAEYLNQSTTTDFYSTSSVSVASGWNDTDWTLYDLITIKSENIDESLSDFPVYVDLSDLSASFWSTVTDSGGDIRVTTDEASPEELPREVVSASTTLETGELHFKADFINKDADTSFRIWYNGTDVEYATDATYGAENVWSNEYLAVYHSSNGGVDSTSNAVDMTANGNATVSSSGRMGDAFTFDGTGDYYSVSTTSVFGDRTTYTISAWSYLNTIGSTNNVDDGAIYSFGQDSTDTDLVWFNVNNVGADGARAYTFNIKNTSNSNRADATTTPNASEWHYIVSERDSTELEVYYNGNLDGIATAQDGASTNLSSSEARIGSWGVSANMDFDGLIDEVRIASTTRSAAWIRAEYLNQSTTTDFYFLGAGTSGTGSSTLSDHDATQVNSAFSFQNITNGELFAFKLTPESGNATITELTVALSGARKIDVNDFSNIRLLKDHDDDAQYDASDEQVATGVMSLNSQGNRANQLGTIVFDADFLSTTTTNYLVVADWNYPDNGSSLRFDIQPSGIIAIDNDGAHQILGGVDDIQHRRSNSGGGGISTAVAPSTPPGRSVETGGGTTGGEQIGNDPDFLGPTANNPGFPTGWTNPANMYDQTDGTYATDTNGYATFLSDFAHGVPGTDVITGIEVTLEVSGTTAAGDISVALSSDSGSTLTSAKTTPTLTTTDAVVTLGGPSDLWGRTWSPSDFSDANFNVRVIGNPSSNEVRIDAIQVKVYHQATGGSSGGGGAI